MKCQCGVSANDNDVFILRKCSLCESAPDLLEACKDAAKALFAYIEYNPESPFKDGKGTCYVLGSKETLEKLNQVISKAEGK